MQLSTAADLTSASWDVRVDGRWLGAGPGNSPVLDFPEIDPGAIGSARLLAIWFDDGETYQLTALRPTNAKGQDKDEVTVVLPQTRAEMQVYDPRLSTGYDGEGTPRRFGLELWLGTDPDGDQSPLRMAGEALSDPVTDAGGLSIHPMVAREGERQGLGLYLYLRP